ncbi:MAG: hypothetical protein A2736_01340 [Candidatus Yanofskybacteria bacterium RIFCSPHIGHO2_01_FULL_41_27]|uniref:UDP-N-acetylmuramoyl-tripeptide-D-alanyl-D-alanine ligase n=2 Tax=Candidatus Yanofskyibacteriota TaxID=1752733 RepID=A0A0G0ZS90_9BACT|nr:MAG: UDP-N-acetylmuramoyl-tripeptide-D-alanyl-D-alanine ligase [Candidatus Yanofskybacteria bacterium GW2011_GWC2_41_9]OGN00176.1 MAG: hypothetical protein A2736_01340 [Candidatus Yanofskybacteria bacterium RIFCSPHIGHO2_01_FULL_41_27]OGN09335.1 MAG: hypothetical protein A3C64_01140 [Candidatus Yanofskybacteria bacterium RIFCSPHIGHO2_02_FULL_41_12]OGN20836.1 MAG: hypothetical protein A3B00_02055 [Candidatus Yanofskybacteria bacterium RIFCSPLOWO2_01_FULL_41_33]
MLACYLDQIKSINNYQLTINNPLSLKILQFILTLLAQLYIRRHRPVIVAVTGNVGKTSTKEAIGAVLAKIKRSRMSAGNLNNELGVPLTILGDWSDEYYESGGSPFFWLKVIMLGVWRLVSGASYPEVLILEYGADRPKDIKKLATKFKPHIGVVTAVGEIPVHVEYFSGPEAVAKEKAKLIESLLPSDFAVLNHDDFAVLSMKEKTKAQVFSFGFTEGAKVQISNFDFKIGEDGKPKGLAFKLNSGESFVPVKLEGALGKSQALAASAAAAVGLIFGMNLVTISDALLFYKAPKGRLKLLSGIKNSLIIDDSYNASPSAMHLALDTLKALPRSGRKIAVLGDMLELGKYSIDAHREAGNLAGNFVDLLICVGAKAKFIADSAGNQMPKEHIFSFDTSDEAKTKIVETTKENDLILIKGSQGMRMEKIVEEIMAEPERKKELLVRQSGKWLEK